MFICHFDHFSVLLKCWKVDNEFGDTVKGGYLYGYGMLTLPAN